MVYFNDLEGKITKINLTSSKENDASLFDQTTLFRLNANTVNRRYSFSKWMLVLDYQRKSFGYSVEQEILII